MTGAWKDENWLGGMWKEKSATVFEDVAVQSSYEAISRKLSIENESDDENRHNKCNG